MAQTLKEQLLASARAAAKAAAGMRNAQSSEELHQHLRDYVYAKYLLDTSDEDDIDELTALSIARALKLDKDLMKEVDNAAECTGSTSAMRKKVLLIMSLQKSVGVELTPSATAQASTLKALAELIFTELKGNEK